MTVSLAMATDDSGFDRHGNRRRRKGVPRVDEAPDRPPWLVECPACGAPVGLLCGRRSGRWAVYAYSDVCPERRRASPASGIG